MVWCSTCGTSLEDTIIFCWQCGTKKVSKGSHIVPVNKNNATATVTSDEPGAEGGQSVLNLSAGAMKSLMALKEKVDRPGVKRPPKRKLCSTEKRVIGVQFLDQRGKMIAKIFPGRGGACTNLIRIEVDASSTEEDWKRLLRRKFRGNIVMTFKIPAEDGFTNASSPLNIRSLDNLRRKAKGSELRLYVEAAGLDRKQLKERYIEKEEGRNDDRQSSDDELPDIFVKTRSVLKPKANFLRTERAEEKQPRVVIDRDEPPPKSPQGLPSDVVAPQPRVAIDRDEPPPKSPQGLPSDVVAPPSPPSHVVVLESDDEVDTEMMEFIKIQEKLVKRRENACARIAGGDCHKSKTKQFNVFYMARANRSLCFKTSPDALIGSVYDSICASLSESELAAQFSLRDGDGNMFGVSYKGRMKDVPDTLFLEEEDCTLDKTITNYDDVLF